MMTCLQAKYADQPVSFVLIPCNQFGNQEPKSNAEIKAFAEQYVSFGGGSKVFMLAKSNLNGVTCQNSESDACKPGSSECCPQNDDIYDFLQGQPMDNVTWNFDKFVVNPSGEVVAHLDGSQSVDDAIAEANPAVGAAVSSSPCVLGGGLLATVTHYGLPLIAVLIIAFLCFRQMRKGQQVEAREHNYIAVA